MTEMLPEPIQKRVAVVVPPPNPAVEPEMRMLLPPSVAFHVARLPVQPGADLAERNRRSPSFFVDAMASFGSLASDAGLIAVTGPSFSLTDADAEELDATLQSLGRGPVGRASTAVSEALAVLGCRSITLVSPYEPWLTERARRYWERRGYRVSSVVHMAEEFRPYAISHQEVTELVRRLADEPTDAVLFVANGVMTIPPFLQEHAGTKPLLLSSNLCGAWWLLRQIGFRHGSEVFEAVAPRLAAALRPDESN